MKPQIFYRGQTIVNKGDKIRDLIMIHKGECLIYQNRSDFTNELVSIGQGNFIGEECVLFGKPI